MKHRLLYAGGAGLALLLVVLVWVVRSGSGTHPAPPAAVVAADAAPGPAPVAPAAPVASRIPVDAAPGPVAPPPGEPAAPAAPTEDAPARVVHDHSGEAPPPGSPFTPDTVFTVRKSLAPLVKTCAEPLVRAGSAGSLTLVARFTIAGGKIAATPTAVSHPQWKDDGFDACVKQAVAELGLDAPAGQPDATYRLAMQFKFP